MWRTIKTAIAATILCLVAGITYAQGYHYVNPYYERGGEFHRGHWQSNPDGNPYNNLGYRGGSYPYNPYGY